MRFNMTRDFYIPKDSTVVECGDTDAAVFTYETAGVLYAIGFHGKAQKPDFHYRYSNEQRRVEAIAKYLESRKSHADYMAKRKSESRSAHTLTVGTILVCSWGYDQTNIDYYQVTRIPGPYSVEIRQIAKKSGPETGFMTAHCTADRDNFKGEPMIKRANKTNSVSISSYSSASPWDGKEDRYSWYA